MQKGNRNVFRSVTLTLRSCGNLECLWGQETSGSYPWLQLALSSASDRPGPGSEHRENTHAHKSVQHQSCPNSLVPVRMHIHLCANRPGWDGSDWAIAAGVLRTDRVQGSDSAAPSVWSGRHGQQWWHHERYTFELQGHRGLSGAGAEWKQETSWIHCAQLNKHHQEVIHNPQEKKWSTFTFNLSI